MRMDDEELRRLDFARTKYSQEEQKELLREYVELRLLRKDPYATMKVFMLEPLCEYCRFGVHASARRQGRGLSNGTPANVTKGLGR